MKKLDPLKTIYLEMMDYIFSKIMNFITTIELIWLRKSHLLRESYFG